MNDLKWTCAEIANRTNGMHFTGQWSFVDAACAWAQSSSWRPCPWTTMANAIFSHFKWRTILLALITRRQNWHRNPKSDIWITWINQMDIVNWFLVNIQLREREEVENIIRRVNSVIYTNLYLHLQTQWTKCSKQKWPSKIGSVLFSSSLFHSLFLSRSCSCSLYRSLALTLSRSHCRARSLASPFHGDLLLRKMSWKWVFFCVKCL